jgi:hypothetical protein
MTPRKQKQRQQHQRPASSGLVPASDYESDALNYSHTHILPPTRTNTELNLAVLRRYIPAVRTILSIAANAVVYVFSPTIQQWEKSGVEGTLFVCEQEPQIGASEPGYCMVVLNRRGLDNLILDLAQAEDVETTPELLIIRSQEPGAVDQPQKVLGIWMHKDKDDTQELNGNLIQQCWQRVISLKANYMSQPQAPESVGNGTFAQDSSSISTKGPVAGQRLNITDLFRQQSSQ